LTTLRLLNDNLNIVKTKRAYHHGALREALINAAARLLAEQGPSGVSLREAARRAGVSQAAPYHYFRSKSALLAAVGEAGYQALDDLQRAALARAGDDPFLRLSTLMTIYLRFALERPHYFGAMFRRPAADVSAGTAAARVTERLTDAVRAARAAAGREDLDPSAIATLIWAVPHGLAMLYLEGPIARDGATPVLLEQLARAALEPLIGMGAQEIHGEWAV
jgi:AcrR family transcriptional regulator